MYKVIYFIYKTEQLVNCPSVCPYVLPCTITPCLSIRPVVFSSHVLSFLPVCRTSFCSVSSYPFRLPVCPSARLFFLSCPSVCLFVLTHPTNSCPVCLSFHPFVSSYTFRPSVCLILSVLLCVSVKSKPVPLASEVQCRRLLRDDWGTTSNDIHNWP